MTNSTRVTTALLTALFICTVFAGYFVTARAGNLNPTDPPGPTMKTLDEVEPRIPIPGTADYGSEFVIDEPGSYYLTGNRLNKGDGIVVNADNVTIDLCGYALIGPGTGPGHGVYMSGRRNIEVRNGTIRDFEDHGIYESDNTNGGDHRIINIRATDNGDRGINLYCGGCTVKDCTVSNNGTVGIYVYRVGIITGNTVGSNGSSGIYAPSSCTIINNVVAENTNTGIYAGEGSTAIGNTVKSNGSIGISTGDGVTVFGNAVSENDLSGIKSSGGSRIFNNTVRDNNTDDNSDHAGIHVWTDCTVRDNSLSSNKQYDIYTWGSDNVVEGNTTLDAPYGIYFNGAGCFYANNRASGCTTAAYGGSVPGGSGDGGGNASF